ncbi:hypothetical protein [Gordonia westfalica]|uniref:Uncharacterized protein n=1 Tax=Gordonia westfalica TaxID=158898 RepID=A0A1H2DQN0_9ACTN|nr:hypothetical protein [Gordonia westfalica]SDT85203.1 hypothetical protein SAMN04488548_11713 [Gordonia westfalica]
MAVEHSYVAQSLDGGVYWRHLWYHASTAPVESPEDLNAAFEDHGTAAVDGLSVGITRTSNTVKDFDGGDYVDVQTEYGTSFKIKLLDVDLPSVKRTVAGDDNVTLIPLPAARGSATTSATTRRSFRCRPRVRHEVRQEVQDVRRGEGPRLGDRGVEGRVAGRVGVELTIRAFRNSNGDYVDEFGDVDGIAATSVADPSCRGGI